MAFMKRVRLDDELISQGICADRADALRTLMAGLVSSGGERLTSPGLKVTPGLPLHVKGRIPYVGRGGLKLEGALDTFGINPTGLACLDVGCSTGGFTDCLLKRGAATVVSVDVGRAQFDWSLRQDDRVTLHERTNVTQLPELGYAGAIDLAVCDVSFTCIANIVDAVLACLAPTGAFCTLVKPQFEAPAAHGGIGHNAALTHQRRRSLKLRQLNSLLPRGCSRSMCACRPFMVPRETLSFSCTARDLTPATARKTSCNSRYRF